MSDGFGVGAGHGHGLNFLDGSGDRLVDAALQVHRVHASRHAFQAFCNDGLGQHGSGSGTVTCGIRRLGSDFLDHLSAHVLELVFQFDLFGDGNTVFGDGRGAEGLVQHHVAAFRAQRDLDGVCQDIYTTRHAFTSVIRELNLLSSHVRYFLN